MEKGLFKDMIGVVRAEQLRREIELDTLDPNYQYDHWQFTDLPFLSELYLVVLVALRHQVERDLVRIAALTGGKEISNREYLTNVRNERELLRKPGGWKSLGERLKLAGARGNMSMEVLRHLSNSYKHGPYMEPEKELLKLLQLTPDVSYAPLPESNSLREALALFVGISKDAAFCDIAERFVDKAADHLDDVRSQLKLSSVKRERVSINPRNFLH